MPRSRLFLICLTLVSYPALLILAALRGLDVDYEAFVLPAAFIAILAIVNARYCSLRQKPFLREMTEPLLLGVLLAVPTLLSTYLAAHAGIPLADHWLSAADRALGFNWRSFIDLVDQHLIVARLLEFSYDSFTPQLIVMPVLLSFMGWVDRSYRMVCAYALICFGASFIAAWAPAIGAYPYYQIPIGSLSNINVYHGYFFLDEFNAVRGDADFVFTMGKVKGILTFPSVHAAIAVLCGWAAWRLKYLRYLSLVLNAGMATAALSHGSHYLVDIPAGIALACLCIAIVNVVCGPSPVWAARLSQAT